MKKAMLTIAAMLILMGSVWADRNRVVCINDFGGGRAIDTLTRAVPMAQKRSGYVQRMGRVFRWQLVFKANLPGLGW